MEDEGSLRLLTKAARLYHVHQLRQTEIAARLGISQSRVSRLLQQADESRVIRTVVATPRHDHRDLEDALRERYGLTAAHVIEPAGEGETEILRDLAVAAAAILGEAEGPFPTIGWTSWSRTLREMVDALLPLHVGTTRVIEMLGDLGPPDAQHVAAHATQTLAALCGADPVFLRTPGVLPSTRVAADLLQQDSYVRSALALLDDLDLALVSIGSIDPAPPIVLGRNFFSAQDLKDVKAAGAVGEICLRYIDAEGAAVQSPLDDLTVGVTLDQLRDARERWAVAGGPRKTKPLKAALTGGWIDVLVTDVATARKLAGPARS